MKPPLCAYQSGASDRGVDRPTVGEILERAAQRAGRSTGSAADVLDAIRAERDEQLLGRGTHRSPSTV